MPTRIKGVSGSTSVSESIREGDTIKVICDLYDGESGEAIIDAAEVSFALTGEGLTTPRLAVYPSSGGSSPSPGRYEAAMEVGGAGLYRAVIRAVSLAGERKSEQVAFVVEEVEGWSP